MSAMRPPMLAGPMLRHSSRSNDLTAVVSSPGLSGVGVGVGACGVACCSCAAAAKERDNSTRHASAARKKRLLFSGMGSDSSLKALSGKTWSQRINQTAAARPQTFAPAVVNSILSVKQREAHHRGTENTEGAQRDSKLKSSVQSQCPLCLCGELYSRQNSSLNKPCPCISPSRRAATTARPREAGVDRRCAERKTPNGLKQLQTAPRSHKVRPCRQTSNEVRPCR